MRTRSVRVGSIAIAFFAAAAATGCRGGDAKSPRGGKALPGAPVALPAANIAAPEGALPVAVSPGQALSPAEVAAVLKRMKPISTDPGDQVEFALRERSLPPPRPGETVKTAFPPPPVPDAPPPELAKPLEIVRYAPEGELALVPQVNVTFSHPMVEITSHDDLAKRGVPVKMTPQVPGKWRWVGTKTLVFEAANNERFPMATVYSVEIPAGTPSAIGGSLAQKKTWSFSTPPLVMQASWPSGGPHKRDPILFASFDQKIDPAKVLASITVDGRSGSQLELVSQADIAKDPTVASYSTGAVKGRWLAFRTKDPLPYDKNIVVTVRAGAPSAEGPRKTTEAQSWSFTTFGPMELVEGRCGWDRECPPGTPFGFRFTNPIQEDAWDAAKGISVTPGIPGMQVTTSGNYLSIAGRTKGKTTYTVKIAAGVPDIFGQKLGSEKTYTFKVGSARPQLGGPNQPFVVLDPTAKPEISIYTINHKTVKVSLYQVGPDDWGKWHEYLRRRWDYDQQAPREPPGKKLGTKTVTIKSVDDEMVETGIELGAALEGGRGNVIFMIEPPVQPKNRWERQQVFGWAQVTQIGLDAMVDPEDMVVWANSLRDGKPLDGVDIQVFPKGARGKTGKDGLAKLPLQAGGYLIVARKGSDMAFLPHNPNYWYDGEGWSPSSRTDGARWFVFDDRRLYKPGEEVRFKGWIRAVGAGERGDVFGVMDRPGAPRKGTYKLVDSRGNEVGKGSFDVGKYGGFDSMIKLPGTMNLGWGRLDLQVDSMPVPGSSYSHSFQVEEFRRPEFEVSARTVSPDPHFVGGNAEVSVTASYFAGGPLPNADTTWSVQTSATSYSPPGWDGYTFGTWVPWWSYYRGGYDDEGYGGRYGGGGNWSQHAGKTDGSGTHKLTLPIEGVSPPRPISISAQATVMDVNRQAWTASTAVLAHPSEMYVGMKSPRMFVAKGEPLNIDLVAVDLDGKARPGTAIEVRSVRLEWKQTKGSWHEDEVDEQKCAQTSVAKEVRCTFKTPEGGTYKIRASVKDSKQRENQSELTIWVPGGKQPPQREVKQEQVMLVPDKKEYQHGDVAELLVTAPFYPAEGVLSLRRSGIWSTERFTMKGSSQVLKVKIDEAMVPNLYAQVDLVGAAVRTDDQGNVNTKLPMRVAYATGQINLPVPPRQRTLTVKATPRVSKIEPGGSTDIDIVVTDAAGKPVASSEVALVVVDEAVLALTGYSIPDPVGYFYGERGTETYDHHLRESVILANPEALKKQVQEEERKAEGAKDKMRAVAKEPMPAPAAPPADMEMADESPSAGATAGRGGGGGAAPVKVRADFSALALFAPNLTTDASGKVSAKVKLPDNLTRYRIVAVAVAGEKQFGKGESNLTARLPLMVRPSAPRFLNFGDQFQLPVVVQNQTDQPMTAEIVVRASNAMIIGGADNTAGRRVTIAPNDRVEVRFPAAAVLAGTARFQLGGVSGKWADAAEVSLPVWTPATTEAFATYGEIGGPGAPQGAIAQPVKAPPDTFPQFGGLEITTSSTELQSLTDAVVYLWTYPYECAEQVSSRLMAIASLKDVLGAFQAKGLPPEKELLAGVAHDMKRLGQLQRWNGGWGFWRDDDEWPFITIHVTHALARAKEKGFEVPESMLRRAHDYLKDIEQHIPSFYGPEYRRVLVAYALYVRMRLGDVEPGKARSILAEQPLEKHSMETIGWLWQVMSGDPRSKTEVDKIRRHLENRAVEEAGTAHWATAYDDSSYLLLASNRRIDGLLLEGYIKDQPESTLIPKVVRGLLGHKVAGHWGSTQEDAWVLLGLDAYFNKYEKDTPDYTARIWLGELFAGEHEFKGRTTERHHVDVPMAFLARTEAKQTLTIAMQGAAKGRMYYRIGMNYAPRNLKLPPSEHGFTVLREYEGIEKPTDVSKDKDGVWHVRAGAQVRVRVTMVVPTRRYHVALVDPVPAGLEIQNPALATTGRAPQDPKEQSGNRYWWWWYPWYEHQNLRDERAEAFSTLVWEGVHTYSYVTRATTPGNFVVPPAKAEEMYHPETFGRSASDRVIVE